MTDEAISPLSRRMIEDMTIRKIAPKTQQGYIRCGPCGPFPARRGRPCGHAPPAPLSTLLLLLSSAAIGDRMTRRGDRAGAKERTKRVPRRIGPAKQAVDEKTPQNTKQSSYQAPAP